MVPSHWLERQKQCSLLGNKEISEVINILYVSFGLLYFLTREYVLYIIPDLMYYKDLVA